MSKSTDLNKSSLYTILIVVLTVSSTLESLRTTIAYPARSILLLDINLISGLIYYLYSKSFSAKYSGVMTFFISLSIGVEHIK